MFAGETVMRLTRLTSEKSGLAYRPALQGRPKSETRGCGSLTSTEAYLSLERLKETETS